ncbi:MAG: hypothetical protein GIKADHBN_00146 [Phycisphaerales bacterium]|nr:hypothetical protein [Phycisphaerales bacterium]
MPRDVKDGGRVTNRARHDELLGVLYDQLRAVAQAKLNQERRDHTLQATALVHEVFLRLSSQERAQWHSQEQFLAIAAQTMRRVLVDHARARHTEKRGGDAHRVTISDALPDRSAPEADVLELDLALDELARVDERAARVVELRYFAGLDIAGAAGALGVSVRTVNYEWRFARAWLVNRLQTPRDKQCT